MTSTSTFTTQGNFRIQSRYSWGGNSDHSEVIVECLTCGQGWHSDFDNETPEPEHDTGECSRFSGNAAQAAAGLATLAGRACVAHYQPTEDWSSGVWVFRFADEIPIRPPSEDEPF